ncbi:hypothetical protein WDW37_20755 [Bdellovibrionota bacterium FG-1]
MSIHKLEREFSDLCTKISFRELELNPEIERELGVIKRMIMKAKSRLRDAEKRSAARVAKRAQSVFG